MAFDSKGIFAFVLRRFCGECEISRWCVAVCVGVCVCVSTVDGWDEARCPICDAEVWMMVMNYSMDVINYPIVGESSHQHHFRHNLSIRQTSIKWPNELLHSIEWITAVDDNRSGLLSPYKSLYERFPQVFEGSFRRLDTAFGFCPENWFRRDGRVYEYVRKGDERRAVTLIFSKKLEIMNEFMIFARQMGDLSPDFESPRNPFWVPKELMILLVKIFNPQPTQDLINSSPRQPTVVEHARKRHAKIHSMNEQDEFESIPNHKPKIPCGLIDWLIR